MVAIDLDGTLLRSNKAMSRRSMNAIAAAARQGVHVVLATARPPRSVKEIYNCLGLKTPQVNYNGALIFDPVSGRNVYHQPLSAEMAGKIIALARKLEPEVVISLEILDKWYTDHVDEELPTETSRAFTPDFIGPLDAFLRTPITKLMLLQKQEKLEKVRLNIVKKFGAKITLAVSDAHLVQVVDKGVDKGAALARIAHSLGIPAQRVMAIGDAPNDIGMLRWAGLSVAVENAWPAVRAEADVVVPSNDEDGVAQALERFVLMA